METINWIYENSQFFVVVILIIILFRFILSIIDFGLSTKQVNEELDEPRKQWFFTLDGEAGYFILKYLFFSVSEKESHSAFIRIISNISLIIQWIIIITLLVIAVAKA